MAATLEVCQKQKVAIYLLVAEGKNRSEILKQKHVYKNYTISQFAMLEQQKDGKKRIKRWTRPA